jgi:type II secretory pathway pseudopilin PulG
MPYINNITGVRTALTLAEMIIAMAIMAVVLAVVLPQFEAIRNSWNSKAGAAETLQNGRILTEHMYRNLSTAVKITAVSNSSETNGYIEFENNDGDNLRYDVNSTDNYIEFGESGDLSDLAGPVSQLLFKCYDINDFDTPITDVNSIRFVRAEIIFTNSEPYGQNKTFAVSAHLRANWNSGTSSSGLVGWWKMDETFGLIASDSSGNDNHGILINILSDKWTTGIMGGALELDGYNDYVYLPIDSVIGSLTDCTISTWVNWSGQGSSWQRIWDFGTGQTYNMFLTPNASGNRLRFAITLSSWSDEDQTTASEELPTGWHHVVVVIDPSNNKHTLYLDGEVVAENTSARYTPSDLGNTNQNWLGRSQYIADPYFNGLLDDVRIYNRILEPEQIAQLTDVLRYRELTEAKTSSDTTSITITTPDTNEGDLLIAAVATDGDTSSSLAPPGGESWTEIYTGDYSNEVTLGAWWKLADASESSSHEFTWLPDEQAYAWMMRITGHKASNPINDYSASGESSSTPTSPEVTTTLDNSLILRLGAFDDDDITVDDPGLSNHTAITMDKSGSVGGGMVAILGSWASGTTHAKESGTNRALIFIAHGESSSSMNLSSVTYGGQAMTKITDWNYYAAHGRAYASAYILDEAGIAAATTSTFTPTWSYPTPGSSGYASVFLANVNQTTSTGATASGGRTSNPVMTSSALATSSGDMVILAATCGQRGSYTLNNGFTEGIDQQMGSTVTGVTGHKSATVANETPSATWYGYDGINRQMIIGFVVQVVTGGGSGSVSGGAGYTMQSVSGDSGTSNFSLDSSNQAQTLTIAIAPELVSEGGGGGGISP